MFARRLVVVLAVATWLAPNCDSAWSQRRFAPGADAKLPELQLVGEVQAVMPGYLQVKSGDLLWTLRVPQQARVEVKGKAKLEALVPGQFVSFIATVDPKTGKAEQKVSKAMLFTPDIQRVPGALPESFAGAFGQAEGKKDGKKDGKGEAKADAGGFGSGFGGAPAFGGGAATGFGGRKTKAGGGKAAQPTGPQSFEVRGQITGMQNGAMSVRVPPNVYFQRASVTVEIGDDADIDVELSGTQSIMLCRKGDKIQIRGQQMGPNTGSVGQADITLSEPLGTVDEQAGAKKAASKLDKRSRSKKSKKDAEGDAEEKAEPKAE